jgi:hypothetical protein
MKQLYGDAAGLSHKRCLRHIMESQTLASFRLAEAESQQIARFCRDNASCYAGRVKANALIDETEPESGRCKGAQAPALYARRHPDVRTVVRGISVEPAPS